MEVTTRVVAGDVIIDLVDGAKTGVGEGFIEAINRLLDQGHRTFVLDLGRVSWVDSAGMGDIVRVYTVITRRGGVLRIEGLSQRLQKELGLPRSTRPFDVSGYPPTDPFNPHLHDLYRKAAFAAGSVMLLVIVIVIIWTWGGLSSGR